MLPFAPFAAWGARSAAGDGVIAGTDAAGITAGGMTAAGTARGGGGACEC